MGPLTFRLDVRDPARRRIRVELRAPVRSLSGAPQSVADKADAASVELFLPAWTPGSYLIREYAKHVLDFRATCGTTEAPIRHRKTAKNRFLLEPGSDCEEIIVQYDLYAHELSVRTSDVTDRHAFLSGAAVFLWPAGKPHVADVEIELQTPQSWTVETSLPTESVDSGRFRMRATGLDHLIDSPILAGELEVIPFSVMGKNHSLVLDGLDGIRPPSTLVPDTEAIIEQAAAIFGGTVPYEEYKFLCMFTDTGRGGLEHLSSTALLAPRTTFRPAKDYRDFMGLVAHEFFHVWNVKRMRPAELWEFDYEQENHTEFLWLAEGFTAYYDDHLCRRAGVLSSEQYLKIVAEGITELRRTPGRHHQSLAEASYDAWIRLYRPDENSRNATLSYYGNGALVGLALDLHIRASTEGERSLDDAVRALYRETYEAGRGYTREDVLRVLEHAASTDLSAFLDSMVHAPLDPDFESLFAPLGLRLDGDRSKSNPYLGVHFKAGTTTIASVIDGGPADAAGIMPGDEILALDELRVTSRGWSQIFDQTVEDGRPLEVLLARRGRIAVLEAVPEPRTAPKLSLVRSEDATEEQDRLRQGWLFETE